MTDRQRPSNRRPSITREVAWRTDTSEHVFHLTIGFDPLNGAPLEVFYADGQRVGSQLQHAIQDACVLISLLLQHGVAPSAIGHSLSTQPHGEDARPATVIGVIAATILEGH